MSPAPDLVEQMYCGQQIHIPPTFPYILKQYAKAAIRTQPYDLLRWSAAYFRAMANSEEPPVKVRLEYPPVDVPSGLTPGYLKVLLKQFEGQTFVLTELLFTKWKGVCLNENALQEMLDIGSFDEEVNFLQFIAISAGHLTHSLSQTMVLLCELLTEEPEGGSSMIPCFVFIDLYRYLATMNCGPPGSPEEEEEENEEKKEDGDKALMETESPGAGIEEVETAEPEEYLLAGETQEGAGDRRDEEIEGQEEGDGGDEDIEGQEEGEGGDEAIEGQEVETNEEEDTIEVANTVGDENAENDEQEEVEVEKTVTDAEESVDVEGTEAEESGAVEGTEAEESGGVEGTEARESGGGEESGGEEGTEAGESGGGDGTEAGDSGEGEEGICDTQVEEEQQEDVAEQEEDSTIQLSLSKRKKKHVEVPGIGPVIPDDQIESVVEYMMYWAERQEGMVMPRNVRHFLCPPLDIIPLPEP